LFNNRPIIQGCKPIVSDNKTILQNQQTVNIAELLIAELFYYSAKNHSANLKMTAIRN